MALYKRHTTLADMYIYMYICSLLDFKFMASIMAFY